MATKDDNERIEAIKKVISRQFQIELQSRTEQLTLIERRISETQKALHALRIALVTSYYNENEKVTANLLTNESTLPQNGTKLHPALKKLLGPKNSGEYKFDFTKGERRAKIKASDSVDTSKVKLKKKKAEESNQVKLKEEMLPNVTVKVEPDAKEEIYGVRNRKCTKYNILVGNVSRAIANSSSEDKSTHKWLAYVRPPEQGANVIPLIQKVVFYIHSSYSPNDVIEIKEPPFQLQRRGWGEFPIRIRLYFKSSRNKCVDIIHNLTLDRTYCGRTCLGKQETVMLLLYDDDNVTLPVERDFIKKEYDENNIFELSSTLEQPPVNIFESVPRNKVELEPNDDILESSNKADIYSHVTEHNYFLSETVNNKFEDEANTSILMDHSYFSANSSTVSCSTDYSFQTSTDLIHGLLKNENHPMTTETVVEEPVLEDVKSFTSTAIVMNNKRKRRPQESLLKKLFHNQYKRSTYSNIQSENSLVQVVQNFNKKDVRRINLKEYTVDFPSQHFNCVLQALPYLFKRLPIISELSSDVNYKCTYPYTSSSKEEYSRWNIGKRLSCEWGRAKTIGKILKEACTVGAKDLTTKDIIMYGRAYGYTPFSNYNCFKKYIFPSILSPSKDIQCDDKNNVVLKHDSCEVDVDIADMSFDSGYQKESTTATEQYVDGSCQLACTYVKELALDEGILLKREEIIPGVLFNGAERVLLQAGLCFAEDLIRNARANLVKQGNFSEEKSILNAEDIRQALKNKPKCNVLIRKYLEERQFPR